MSTTVQNISWYDSPSTLRQVLFALCDRNRKNKELDKKHQIEVSAFQKKTVGILRDRRNREDPLMFWNSKFTLNE